MLQTNVKGDLNELNTRHTFNGFFRGNTKANELFDNRFLLVWADWPLFENCPAYTFHCHIFCYDNIYYNVCKKSQSR